jgi:quercetin dioxygenase-like cupin family protein
VIDRQEAQEPPADRLRPPPAERFAGTKHIFFLREVLGGLRTEDHPARNGHRQVTLFHREQVTQVLFAFEADGYLKEHSAPGLVVIHVLEGHLRVEAGARTYDLPEGHELVLDPNVPHDVHAVARSAMLLTVHLRTTD